MPDTAKESIRHRLKAGANRWQKFHLRAALLISRQSRFQTVTMKEAKKLVNSGGTAEYELRPVGGGLFLFSRMARVNMRSRRRKNG